MTLNEFSATLSQSSLPSDLPPILQALWQDAKGNWSAAHQIAQSHEGAPAYDRLHAYLHRKEGDNSNARYWYRRAGAAEFSGPLEKEWEELAGQSLKSGPSPK